MRRHSILGILVVLGLLGLTAVTWVLAQQTITYTTYYPAPYGEYVNLLFSGRLDAQAPAAVPPVSNANEGRIYYEGPPTNKFKVSENAGTYVDLVGGGAWTWDTVNGTVTLTTPTDNVGIGTASPTEKLHVVGEDIMHENPTGPARQFLRGTGPAPNAASLIRLEDTRGSYFFELRNFHYGGLNTFEVTGANSDLTGRTVPFWIEQRAPSNMLVLHRSGNVGIGTAAPATKLHVAGSITTAGGSYPDYVFEPHYVLESIDSHAEFMWTNRYLKTVPRPTLTENGKKNIDMTATLLGILEELEKAHIYIEQLHKRLKALEEKLSSQGIQD